MKLLWRISCRNVKVPGMTASKIKFSEKIYGSPTRDLISVWYLLFSKQLCVILWLLRRCPTGGCLWQTSRAAICERPDNVEGIQRLRELPQKKKKHVAWPSVQKTGNVFVRSSMGKLENGWTHLMMYLKICRHRSDRTCFHRKKKSLRT